MSSNAAVVITAGVTAFGVGALVYFGLRNPRIRGEVQKMARFITFGDLDRLERKIDGVNRRLADFKRDDRDLGEIKTTLTAIRRDIDDIKEKQTMAVTKGDFEGLRSEIDGVTNTLAQGQTKIADRIERLTAKLAEGGMTPEEETAALEALRATVAPLRAISDGLTALGQDPTNPVPDIPPVDVPPAEGEV